MSEDDKKLAAKIDRDSHYRVGALRAAVERAGQDGGITNSKVDVLDLAELYFGWLLGKQDSEKPTLEKMLKGEKKK